MPSFSLVFQPWMPVILEDGSAAELSLLETLQQAEGIRGIGGSPIESAVLIRLLLAIAHVVKTPKDEFEWLDLWNNRHSHIAAMISYLEARQQVFNLYDEKRPFGQNSNLDPGSATPAALVYERASGNNPVFLDHSRKEEPWPISSAQAARAMLVIHAYGGSGTGGNNPLNGGKKDQMLAGPLCGRLIAFIVGDSLAETILLNLGSNLRAGKPAWDRQAASGPSQTPSEGVADLYTRNTRAIRLKPDADGKNCVGAAIFQGEAVAGSEESTSDPMIPRYLGSDKKYKELRLSPDRSVWRSADVLLAAAENPKTRPIRALEQLRPLASGGMVSPTGLISLRIIGIAANAQGPVTTLWRDETLPFGLSVIADDARYAALERAINNAKYKQEQLEKRLEQFAQSYLDLDAKVRLRGDPMKEAEEVRSFIGELVGFRKEKRGKEIITIPLYTDYWAAIAPAGESIACNDFDEKAWSRHLKDASEDAFHRAIDRLPPDARRYRAEFAHSTNEQKEGAVA